MNRIKIAALGASIALAGGVALAASPAALACTGSCNGGGTVGASISIPTSFAFTLNTSSITFTGPVGGMSNDPTVSYSVLTNDGAGYSVSVNSAGPNLVGVNPADAFPVEDISLWGPAQANAASTNPLPVGQYYPTSLSPTAQTVVSESGPSALSGDNWVDHYGFLGGTAGVYEQADLGNIGSAIPAVPSDTYSTTLDYVAIAN